MVARRIVRVLVPYSKTLYFVDLGGRQRGMSYDFMREYEAQLNRNRGRDALRVEVVFIPTASDQLLPMLIAGHGDVVAADLTITPERQRLVDFLTPVATGVKEVVVTGPGAPPLRTLDDLAGQQILVRRTSSYYESLTALNAQFRQRHLVPMVLREAPGHFGTEDLLEMANAGLVKIVIADSYLANFWGQVFPNLTVHPDLAVRSSGDIAFAIRKRSPQLKAELDAFTRGHRAGTLFGNVVLQKYLRTTQWARNATSEAERARFNSMVALFRKYGDRYGVDWLLMAAQGYQESQLDQQRRSQVGAIGVMQLMPATGRQMNVGDVTQLEPNIHAGIKYMRLMVDTYFTDGPVDALNRLLFGFASYNAGPNRIQRWRDVARKRNLNPNVWFNNVERIAAEQIGNETVQYVANIYKYYVAYTLVQEEVVRELQK
jgi:membrane-bound lytic murein transglycosylase MltF